MPYRVLDHTADVGIEATAASFPDLVTELATGMFAFIADVGPCPQDRSISMVIEAEAREDLVVEALAELLYASEANDLVFCDFEVTQPREGRLEIEAWGVGSGGLELHGAPVKAVTYHEVEVRSDDTGWYARVYLDV